MSDFIYPLATVVLDFLCAVICIRLMISRRRFVWFIPLVMSMALLFGGAVCLAAAVSVTAGRILGQRISSYMAYFIFGASVLWTLTMIAFAAVTDKEKRASRESKRAENEAAYIRRKAAVNTRATGVSKVKSLEAADKAVRKNLDLYDAGPLPTVRVKRTV
ncbi:MAG: hypothetical protein J5775_03905 [Spirochaetales bacterium]|nr:hypothetical protein [Spirochaetales bacterium]